MFHQSKFFIPATVVFSFLSSFFVSRFGILPDQWIVSLVFMFLFALPSFLFLIKRNKQKALLTLIILSIFSLVIESFAIRTGFPYGSFHYQDMLGPKILGLAPVAVPLGWIPLVLGSYALVNTMKLPFVVLSTAITLVLVDMVIDPGSFALGIWIWQDLGFFYGVPLQNFVGWFFSGLIGAWILHVIVGEILADEDYTMIFISLIGILTFWTGIAFFKELLVPMILGCVFLGVLFVSIKAQSRP